ncbi:UDP-glucose/GDP-mannose dehydrogenase family protein [Candidatus Aminicenantes bacterium AC-708-M15]|jgi:UDPglucose 6-dehydrogenase|nr:UDP-glucose/GDP-mannose dehydrogenase family protein [SCandidatus Aminicenantes bacterium Aminicenantia_JdfR_composite]MCP2597201.1 UDP-glucose/GDP-mannose dehydrogenase family protein [Candidatus Aminicenantes bacterium AC-335-G13]MCP2598390.1 UDP-glucose/GDP-mannose dehydrogenase family protein [Candidatus Aminicenantes bacterium AC-335-L06]MCP2604143.1 UDP-glucose/GDP-mannose dehydrogenase family protein [Candidatus Aminicenantes bacterium AC-708-M15]MCP2606259.1 UDP-glucose/GDP-mannose d
MKISIFGIGYVGLVTGACFAEMGNDVWCVDIDKKKIDDLNKGILPIYEPGLEPLVKRNFSEGRLKFTTNSKEAIQNTDIIFIAVGTPANSDGSVEMKYVLKVAEEIAKHLNGYKIIAIKSTVPVGTAEKIKDLIQRELNKRNSSFDFDVVSNPEFLKEGDAVNDCLKPDRIILGCSSEKAYRIMTELYHPFSRSREKIILMDNRSAEMTKYAANTMLATRISFMNEIANLCEKLNADVEKVRIGIGADPRIGNKFIYPGVGFGGSCFPKDIRALIKMGSDNNYTMRILEAVEEVNEEQKKILIKKMEKFYSSKFENLIIAMWGLSFKPETDDIREAPSIVTIKELLKRQVKEIKVYDPAAMNNIRRFFGKEEKIIYAKDHYSALKNANCLLILTEWKVFRRPDFELMKKLMKESVIFDGRNLYDPQEMREFGFTYISIGRSQT